MNCKNFRRRTKKYETYFYCTCLKKNINFNDCQKCMRKEYKEYKKIKNKTSDLSKLERNRFSIITSDLEHCYLCEIEHKKKATNKHEAFYGTADRKLSMKYGLVVPLCDQHHTIGNLAVHNNYFTDIKLKQIAQKKFEEKYGHEEFMKIFKKNYL